MSDASFSEEVVDKARGYLAAGRVERLDEPGHGFRVRGSKPYIVRLGLEDRRAIWAVCSCPHGQRAAVGFPRCSHVVAALIRVREEPADEA